MYTLMSPSSVVTTSVEPVTPNAATDAEVGVPTISAPMATPACPGNGKMMVGWLLDRTTIIPVPLETPLDPVPVLTGPLLEGLGDSTTLKLTLSEFQLELATLA